MAKIQKIFRIHQLRLTPTIPINISDNLPWAPVGWGWNYLPLFRSFYNFYFLVYILTVYIILSSACTQQINPSTTEFSYFGSGICSRLLQRSCFLRNMNKALSPATFFRHFRISRGFPPFISGLVSIQMDVTSKVPPS